MSLLSDTNSLESAIQPSLVYPSLFQNGGKHQQTRPSLSKYYSIETTKDELSSTLSSQDNVQTTKELQACIHFASRLIKLRSELRSPSYMRTCPSPQHQHQDYFNSQQQQHYNKSPPLSEVGRVHSLPNVFQYIQQEEQQQQHYCHPYEKKLNFCEDESEIISLNSNSSTDEASQLTYLSELKRRSSKSNNKKESRGGGLNLPPKYQLSNHRNLSNIPPNSTLKHRSLSLHDMIHEVVDEAINNSNKPMKRERFSSLALASQLIYASSSTEEKKEEQEELKEVVLNEKVQLDQESKFLSSIKRDTTAAISTTYVTPAIIDTIYPQPSQSRDTNKSLFSTLSSDSEGEEDAHHKRTLVNKRRPTAAFLVSISPSSAAAATVAKSRRNNKQTRTKLTQVYSSSSKA